MVILLTPTLRRGWALLRPLYKYFFCSGIPLSHLTNFLMYVIFFVRGFNSKPPSEHKMLKYLMLCHTKGKKAENTNAPFLKINRRAYSGT